MEVSTIDRTGAVTVPADTARPARRRRWLRRDGRGASRSPQAQQLEQLEVELALLREENARLKVARQRARDRPVNERVRELLPAQADEAAGDGDPWELLTDCLLLRDGLIAACREIQLTMHETRRRLEAHAVPGETPEREALGRPAAREGVESPA